MKKTELINKTSRKFGKIGLKLKKHSPEILVIAGVVGVVTSTVLACKATTKASKIIEKAKKDIQVIHDCEEHPENLSEPYTKEDSKKDLTIVYAHTGLELIKVYAPAIAVGALSITSILASTNILRKRNVALAAAYTTVDKSFRGYRNRVIERFGEELDKELKYNIKSKEIEETVVDEKGKEKKVKKVINVAEPENYSMYARCYTNGCDGWERDSEHNLWFLTQQQNWANDKLKAQGYLFLNDVYESLGIPKTKAGQIVGWIYDEKNPRGDNYVDFGIHNINREVNRDFVNGYEQSIWLDFNVDGPILDLI